MKRIPYGRQLITDEDIEAVNSILRSDFITTGPANIEFENKLASTLNAKYAVIFNSGTSALNGAYFVLGVEEGSEFITTPLTFVATANAGLHLGLKPVFSDIENDTGNLDAHLIEEKITDRTKFIVPVHYAGHPVDMEAISKIAEKHNLKIVEDATHAVGAKYKNKKIGDCSLSEMAVFSFHPVKHITCGEGGAVLTNNEEYFRKLKMFRSHGIRKFDLENKTEGEWYYEMHILGHNYRMTDFQAALGISQISRLESNIIRRREIAEEYDRAFRNHPFFHIPPERDYARSSYHLYPVRMKDKTRRRIFFEKLHKNNIKVQVHYIPVYLQPYYKKLGYRKGLCPVAEDFYEREISLPIYPGLNTKDQAYVINRINKIIYEC